MELPRYTTTYITIFSMFVTILHVLTQYTVTVTVALATRNGACKVGYAIVVCVHA